MGCFESTAGAVCVVSALLSVSGLAYGSDTGGESELGRVRHAGHLYFNIATGERLMTSDKLQGAALRNDSGSEEIWVMGGDAPCADVGSTSSFFYAVDRTEDTSGHAFVSPMLIDWGDIEMNTVVDCVQVHWITNHADTDLDMDTFADGVPGFGATWTFWDGMNGRSPQMESIAVPIIEFSFFNLPGELSDPGDSFVSFYTADIDLGASFGNSLVFEIGDTDSDLQGAAVHNARMDLRDEDGDMIPDIDPDQDGKADWGWSIDYTQPGTVDVDNADSDSDPMTGIDGDPGARATAGLAFGMPSPGHSEFDSKSGEWSWVYDGTDVVCTEDLFTEVHDSVNVGPFNFGGFSCDPYVPFGSFAIVLYGPVDREPCIEVLDFIDLNGDQSFDFLDIHDFLTIGRDLNGDGYFDFLDIVIFLEYFEQWQNCDL